MTEKRELTEEDLELVDKFKEKWESIAFSTDSIDKEKATSAVKELYKFLGLEEPKIIFVPSPEEMFKQVDKLLKENGITDKTGRDYAEQIIYGCYEVGWISFYDYAVNGLNIEKLEKINYLIALIETTGLGLYFEQACVISDKPCVLQLDGENRLHDIEGPAIKYRDGYAKYYVHGVRVPEMVIMRPEEITVKMIIDEENAEVRRVMIDQFGADKFIQESDSEVVDEDSEFGTLFRIELEDDEPIVMVKVVNSSPDPETGEFHDYFLRVPPDITRAKQAVAWTFDVEEKEYQPQQET